MRAWPVIALVATAQAADMKARFLNGDVLPGSMRSVADEVVVWDSEAFVRPHPLRRDQLDDILMDSTAAAGFPPGDHIAVVTLTNGDELRGALLKVDDQEIGLKTTYAGDLVFRRDMVGSLVIEERPEIHYAGPNSLDEWVSSREDAWEYEDQTLICKKVSSISRDVGEHDRYRVAFTLEWRGTASFRLYTCADDPDLDDVRNCFELVCQRHVAYMRKRTTLNGRSENSTIGHGGGMRELQENEKVRFELLHDRIAGRIRLMLDGRIVADWREPVPGGGQMGDYLHFHADRSNDLRLSRIEVTSWDGVPEGGWQEEEFDFLGDMEMEEDPDGEAEKDGPAITLRNGDQLDGKIEGIEEGRAHLKSPLKDFSLPVSRLHTFALRTEEEAADPELTWKPKRYAGDVRATLADGSHVTFQLLGLTDRTLTGRSQTFGEADFELSAIRRIEFNLYRDPLGGDLDFQRW